MITPSRPLRLAVYGHLNQHAGSSSASHYLLAEELLRRGHRLDLYAVANFVTPQNLARFPNLTYHPAALGPLDDVFHFLHTRLPRRLGLLPCFLLNEVRMRQYYRKIGRLMAARHRERPYDALLVLDLFFNPFRPVEELPSFVWMQGIHKAELDAIRAQKPAIVRLCGRMYYAALIAYYHYKVAVARSRLGKCDRVIACSRWAADVFEGLGVPLGRLAVVPFMLDLERFRPPASYAERGREVVFLHLGRIVPRKRLDLLLDAFARLRGEDSDVRLRVIGHFAYGEGYRRLLGLDHLPPGVDYCPKVERAEVPELFRQVDALVQPSENENFGSSVMEALGSGVPVIAGPTNGTAEFAPGDFLFEEYTPESLLAALRRCAAAVRADRAAVARQARRAAEDAFRIGRVTDQVVDLIRGEKWSGRPAAAGHSEA